MTVRPRLQFAVVARGLGATALYGSFARVAAAGRSFLRYGAVANGRVLWGLLDVSKDEQMLLRYRTKLWFMNAERPARGNPCQR